MNIKNLLIAAGLIAVVALTGCEAQKPLTDAAEAPVVATEVAPLVVAVAVVLP